MGDKAALASLFVNNGVVDPKEMRRIYDEGGDVGDIKPAVAEASYPREREVLDLVDKSDADFVSRLKDENRVTIPDWEGKGETATHKLGYAEVDGKYIVYPLVQNIDGKLYDFSDPQYGMDKGWQALDSALYAGDYVELPSKADARWFTESYKNHYPGFNKYDGKTEKSQKMVVLGKDDYLAPGELEAAVVTSDRKPKMEMPIDYFFPERNDVDNKIDTLRDVMQSMVDREKRKPTPVDILESYRSAYNNPFLANPFYKRRAGINRFDEGGDTEEVFDTIDPSVKSAIDLRGLSRRQIKDKAYDLVGEYDENNDLIGTKRAKRIFNRAQRRYYNKALERQNVRDRNKYLIEAIRRGDTQAYKDYITEGRDRFANKYVLPVMVGSGAAGAAGGLGALIGMAGDLGIYNISGGKKDSFGDLVIDRTEHPYLSMAAEVLNPLNYIPFGNSIYDKSMAGIEKSTGLGSEVDFKNLLRYTDNQVFDINEAPTLDNLGAVFENRVYPKGGGDYDFRVVTDRSAIDDVNKTGLVRSKIGWHHDSYNYVNDKYGDWLNKNLPEWINMNPLDVANILSKNGFDLDKIERFNFRQSQNHGNTVGFSRGITFYGPSDNDYLIVGKHNDNIFQYGLRGRKRDVQGNGMGATLLMNPDGTAKNAMAPSNRFIYYKKIGDNWVPNSFIGKDKIRFGNMFKTNLGDDDYMYRTLIGDRAGEAAVEAIRSGQVRSVSKFGMPYFNYRNPVKTQVGEFVLRLPKKQVGFDNMQWINVNPYTYIDDMLDEKTFMNISGNQFVPSLYGDFSKAPYTKDAQLWLKKSIFGFPYYKRLD